MAIIHKPKKLKYKDGLSLDDIDNINIHSIDWQNSKAYMIHVLEGNDLWTLGDIRKVLETKGIDGLYKMQKIGITCVSEILKCMEYFYPKLTIARPQEIVNEETLYSYMPTSNDRKQSISNGINVDGEIYKVSRF